MRNALNQQWLFIPKPKLGESTLTYIGQDTPNLAKINFSVLLGGVPVKKITLDMVSASRKNWRVDLKICWQLLDLLIRMCMIIDFFRIRKTLLVFVCF